MHQKAEKQPGGWETIREQLRNYGIDLENLCGGEIDPARVKVICLAPGLQESVREIGATTRDQVVMVRVDEETVQALDAWVDTEAVKSRSGAAALFIREGLKVRSSELEQLSGALHDVEAARQRLRKQARNVLGEQD